MRLLQWLHSLNRFFDDPEIREPDGMYGPGQPFPSRGAHMRALEAHLKAHADEADRDSFMAS